MNYVNPIQFVKLNDINFQNLKFRFSLGVLKMSKLNTDEEQEKKVTVRYSDEELEEFRRIIIEAKEETQEELDMLKERLDDLTEMDPAESMIYSMHMAEQGSEMQEQEKTYAQIQRIYEYMKKLDEALGRINDKTYGVCRVCNCLIAKERLIAVPVTTLSASYKIHQKCPEDGIDRIEARNSRASENTI